MHLTNPIHCNKYRAQCLVSAMCPPFTAKRLLTLSFELFQLQLLLLWKYWFSLQNLSTSSNMLGHGIIKFHLATKGDLFSLKYSIHHLKSSPSFVLQFNSNKYVLLQPLIATYVASSYFIKFGNSSKNHEYGVHLVAEKSWSQPLQSNWTVTMGIW